ncbi:MAG: acyloxyacyl hydrolase [Chlorobi bacterium]|nr:acyloxyacyl hydrolase [Chlorobiota bacterium]
MKLFKVKIILLVFVLIQPMVLRAQQTKLDSFLTHTPIFIRAGFQNGCVIPTNEFIRGHNFLKDTIDSYNSISFLLLKQTKGDKLWEQVYGYPVFGVGIYSALFNETKELGVPISVYGFFSAPFIRINKFSFNYELGLGLAFNWNSFDPVENPNNIAISAEQSTYIEAGLNLEYRVARRYYLSAGYGFYHFSNGKLKLPNKGLNTKAVKFSMRYQLNNVSYSFIKRDVPKFEKHFEWDIDVYGGVKNVIYKGGDVDIITKYEGVYYPVYGINNTFSRSLNYKSKVGFGFSIGYNGAINAQIAVEEGELDPVGQPFGDHLDVNIYPSYELVVDRLAFVLQPGFYIYRKRASGLTPGFYQRIGVKYHFLKDYFLGVSLRAFHFQESDFIEWNIGRRIKW